jgi:LmbE family N-acetylglucosaminyl deacetylase
MSPRSLPKGTAIRSIGRLLFPPVEVGWTLIFSAVGLLLRPRLRYIEPTGLDRVLVVAPHPDDETIGCGGTIALHSIMGDQVTVCLVTDGGNSRVAGLSQDEVCRRRRDEARRACSFMGNIDLVQLGLPEGKWYDHQLAQALVSLLARYEPTIIYSTSGIDYHPEHVQVARVLAQVLCRPKLVSPTCVRLYEVQVPLTPLLANAATDLSHTIDQKTRALNAYRSQRSSLVWLARLDRYRRGIYRLPGPNEVFWEMSPAAYTLVTQAQQGSPEHYFGIRSRPFTDGVAWLVGTTGRLRLRRFAKEH